MSMNNEPRVVVYCRNSVRGRHAANCDARAEELLAGLSKKWIDTTDVIVRSLMRHLIIGNPIVLASIGCRMMIARGEVGCPGSW